MKHSAQSLRQEQTLVLIKPDGVKRGLVGEIIQRIEQRGLKVIAMQMLWAQRKDLDNHYSNSEENLKSMGEKTLVNYQKQGLNILEEVGTDNPIKIGGMVREWILDFMTSGPIVKMVVQGVHAVEMVRKLVGNTIPANAEMGTIRGDFSVDSAILANAQKRGIRNVIHASGTVTEAEKEIALWFSEKEIYQYQRAEEDTMF
ncbi:MAG TPA: nucleoside-diphosphate kinase [Candidatus Paceibacterota bacterium]